ncbi:MAG: phosphohistidine phosphatase SixA [Planctomycetes bacterium]|nr:phosphohistidine phosphatase SixA [Planctomycetota bacterium]
MLIHLLRHGIAEDPGPGMRDEERALTEEGQRRIRRAAPAWSKVVSTPDIVFTSPLRRARETAVVFAEAVGFLGDLRVEEALVPDAPPSLAASLLEAEALSGCKSVALVGHEPHLGYLLGLVLTGHPRQPIPFKKGMLVCVETESCASLVARLKFALPQRAAGDLG